MENIKIQQPLSLFENVKKYGTEELAYKIAYGKPLSESSTTEECIEWVEFISRELEANFDEPNIKLIRQGCYCTENGKLDENKQWLKDIYTHSRDISEFVDKVNESGAGWYIEHGAIYTKFFDCSCPMLEGIEHLQTKTWCHCTAGFVKEIFEYVLGAEIDAEIIKSIKIGDPFCLVMVRRKDGLPLSGI